MERRTGFVIIQIHTDIDMTNLEKKIEDAAYLYSKGKLNKKYHHWLDGLKSPEAKEYWTTGIGDDLCKIIYQDGDKASDGECIDQIIEYLIENNILFKS